VRPGKEERNENRQHKNDRGAPSYWVFDPTTNVPEIQG
jgi:hypothetical protein